MNNLFNEFILEVLHHLNMIHSGLALVTKFFPIKLILELLRDRRIWAIQN